jgi:hypothetical protein
MSCLQKFCLSWKLLKNYTQYISQLCKHLDNGVVINNNLLTVTSYSYQVYYEVIYKPFKIQIKDIILLFLLTYRVNELQINNGINEKSFSYHTTNRDTISVDVVLQALESSYVEHTVRVS